MTRGHCRARVIASDLQKDSERFILKLLLILSVKPSLPAKRQTAGVALRKLPLQIIVGSKGIMVNWMPETADGMLTRHNRIVDMRIAKANHAAIV